MRRSDQTLSGTQRHEGLLGDPARAPLGRNVKQSLAGSLRPLLSLVVAIAGVLASGWIASSLPHRYRATAIIERSYDQQSVARVPRTATTLRPQIVTRTALREALEHLSSNQQTSEHAPPFDDFLSGISVEIQPIAPLADRVRLRVDHADRQLARQLADQLASRYVVQQQNHQQIQALTQQLTQTKARLAAVQEQWQKHKKDLELSQQPHSQPTNTEYELALAQNRQEIAEVTAAIDQLEASPVVPPASPIPTTPPLVHALRREEQTLAESALRHCLEYRFRLATAYSDRHPAVLSLDRKIAALAREAGLDRIREREGIEQASYQPDSSELARLQQQRERLLRQEAELLSKADSWRELRRSTDQVRNTLEDTAHKRREIQQEVETLQQQLQGALAEQTARLSLRPQLTDVSPLHHNRKSCFLAGVALSAVLALGLGLLSASRKRAPST